MAGGYEPIRLDKSFYNYLVSYLIIRVNEPQGIYKYIFSYHHWIGRLFFFPGFISNRDHEK